MLLKLVKHDFRYSARIFFALGAIAIALAIILSIADSIHMSRNFQNINEVSGIGFQLMPRSNVLFSTMFMAPVFVAAIIHIGQFYRKSMFGKVGHLAMTMPVKRSALLTSKLTVSFVWYLYCMGVVIAMLGVVHLFSPQLNNPGGPVRFLFAEPLTLGLNIALMALFGISLLFFAITLSHSIFKGKRVSSIISGIIGLSLGGIYLYIYNALTMRATPIIETTHTDAAGNIIGHTSRQVAQTGIEYGRIVIGQTHWGTSFYADIFIDIFSE